MSVIKRNIIANILGKGFSAILSVVFVPFYLKFLGSEAYGVIGLFGILQSIFMLADMGLSGAFTRETAKLSALVGKAQEMHDLCRTFEGIFAGIGILITLAIALLSRLIAEHWVNLDQLSVTTVTNTITLIGISIGLQFPFMIYQGGIQGLQRQTLLNILLVGLGFVRGVGAILILKFIEPSIQAFFTWQVIISAIQLAVGYTVTWRAMPVVLVRPRFNLQLIRPLWRFAAGMIGITLCGILLTQADKLILTKMLPLEKFGYYALAGVVASVPGMIAFPVNNAVYPRLIQLVAMKNYSELTDFYHRSCQILAVPVIPIGLVLAFFSKEVMLVWTGSMVTAQNTFLFVTVLAVGSTLMGLMLIPYALQLAFAWTRLGLCLNIISLITLIPSMVWLVSVYGPLGACFVWVALYTGQIIVMIYFMHRNILQGEKWKWYVNDVGKPFLTALIVVVISRLVVNGTMAKSVMIATMGGILFVAISASAMSATHVRNMIRAKIFSLHRTPQIY